MAEKTNITRQTPEQIEQDIAKTRQDMGSTAGEIHERLLPRSFTEQAKEKLRSSTVDRVKDAAGRISGSAKEAGNTIVNTVKSNPVPLAMMSAGLVWFLYNRSQEHRGDGEYLSESAGKLKEKAGDVAGRAQEKFGELSGQVREQGSALAGKAKESASRFTSAAKERARRTGSWFRDQMRDNPFAVIIAALATGAAIGFLIPESSREKQILGSASDTLIARARETAQRTIQKAQHAAEKAVETAQAEFKHS